jgi:hemerythrin-like domain-containing protein
MAKKKAARNDSQNSSEQDAIALLTEDHELVRQMLEELAETTDRGTKKRMELLERIGVAIRAHAKIEEEIFYPAFKDAAKTKEETKLFFEATEEHALVDIVLPELESTDPTTEQFGAKAKVLKDLIDHHADEEEEEMFPKARKLLGKERLTELGSELAERKSEIEQQLQGSSSQSRRSAANGRAARSAQAGAM